MGRIIAVLNQKGGVGKTTTSINVASFLAKNGKNVLLVDLDPQGNATSGLGLEKGSTAGAFGMLIQDLSINDVTVSSKIENLDVVVSGLELSGAELNLAKLEKRELKLKHALSARLDYYDYILIDCPPSLGLLTVNALASANDVLIPVQTEFYAMEGLGQLMQTIQRVQQKLNPTLRILGVVMTMYDSRTALSEQVKAEIVRVFGDLVFKSVIPRNVRLAEAPSHGKSILQYDKWSKGSRAYKSLAKEVISRVGI